MERENLTAAENAALVVWNSRFSSRETLLAAVRAAVEVVERCHEHAEDARLAILLGKVQALAEEYEREPRLIASGAVASMLREWVDA